MKDPIVMPPMTSAQRQAWLALMTLHQRLPAGWTLVGGQMVHLHCAERGAFPMRPTEDVDAVVDVRANQDLLARFTSELAGLGFVPETTGEGLQHRWRRGDAQIDVLIPEGVGDWAAARVGAGGARTLSAPGSSQALQRTEAVRVDVEGRVGTVLRPNLVAALVGKAAARHEIVINAASQRHCTDFVVLASLLSRRDFLATEPTAKDKKRLRKMIGTCRDDVKLMLMDDAAEALHRLERAAGLIG